MKKIKVVPIKKSLDAERYGPCAERFLSIMRSYEGGSFAERAVRAMDDMCPEIPDHGVTFENCAEPAKLYDYLVELTHENPELLEEMHKRSNTTPRIFAVTAMHKKIHQAVVASKHQEEIPLELQRKINMLVNHIWSENSNRIISILGGDVVANTIRIPAFKGVDDIEKLQAQRDMLALVIIVALRYGGMVVYRHELKDGVYEANVFDCRHGNISRIRSTPEMLNTIYAQTKTHIAGTVRQDMFRLSSLTI